MLKKLFKRTLVLRLALITIIIAAVLAAGCAGNTDSGQEQQPGAANEELRGMLQVNGSTTVAPVAQAWAEKFHELHPEVDVIVTGTGSGDGIAALINGTTDIAMASRKIKDSEAEHINGKPKELVVGRDGLAVIVHPDNPVDSLTMEQIKDIFTGKVTNWSEFGGPDKEIIVYTRDTSSGTYGFFKEFVLNDEEYTTAGRKTASNAAMANSIASEETAVGYVGMAFLNNKVKGIAVSNNGTAPVAPTLEAAMAGDYPIVRDLNMYTIGEPEALAKTFLDWGFSSEGQAIVEEIGYLPVK